MYVNPTMFHSILWHLTYFFLFFGGFGNFVAFYYANPLCKSAIRSFLYCNNNITNASIQDEIQIKETISNEISSERTSFFNIYNANNYCYQIEDFDISNIDYSNIIFDDLNEEQLVRHIAVLRSKEIELS